MLKVFLVCLIFALLVLVVNGLARAAESRSTWQVDWEKTLKAAEAEGEVAVYFVDYPRFAVSQFQKAYPRIRLNLVDGPSGPALSSRLMAERRAGKYQADLYIAGQGTHISVLYPAKALASMPSAFIFAGGQRRIKMVQGKASFCRPGNASLVRLSRTSGALHFNQHPESEDRRNQIVVGSGKP